MRADIADALIARGHVARAALVLQQQGRLFIKEGWWDLAATVLQRLLHCEKLLMQVCPLALCCVLLSIEGCQVNVADLNALACLHSLCL